MRLVRHVAALFAASLMLSVQAAPLTIAQAVDPSGVEEASLSPDGRSVALLFYDGYEYDLRLYFPLTDVTRTFKLRGMVTEVGSDVPLTPRSVTWAGNDVMALDYGGLAISVDKRGRFLAELGYEVIRRAHWSDPESPWLLVYTDRTRNEIALVNANNGDRNLLEHPPGTLVNTAFDRNGQLRAVALYSEGGEHGGSYSNWYRASSSEAWQKLAEFGVNDERWHPSYVPDKPHTIAVYSRIGRDTYAYFYYDTERRALGEMLAGHPEEDILSVGGIDQTAYDQVSTGGMRTEHVWLNGKWAGVQQSVDAALPGRTNRLSGNPRGKLLVRSYSDQSPSEWYLLDMETSGMRRLAQSRPAVAGASTRPMEIIHYQSADGMRIPAFLTRPADNAVQQPLVVLIHGGPWVRDYWGWDYEVQLLAAQGYTVFQPQFRGSSGFGKRFEEAGYGQWGLAMQDDITQGVRHLIARGIADPKRICIVGASYGGYAALWGLVKTPELYQCGVSFAGVVDINYMFHDNSDAADSKFARAIRLRRIGDTTANPQQFDEVSPLKHAARIKAPVLLMHGAKDQRVPISHGLKMKQALENNGRQVEWITFAEEGHGLYYKLSATQYYEALFTFLDKHIGKSAVTPH